MAFSFDDRAELRCLCQVSLSLLDAPCSSHVVAKLSADLIVSGYVRPQISFLSWRARLSNSSHSSNYPLRLRDLARSSMASIEVTLLSPFMTVLLKSRSRHLNVVGFMVSVLLEPCN